MVEDAVCNVIDNMVKESKCCSEVMKKHSNKELVITKKDNEYFQNCNNCWICKDVYAENDLQVRDHCHITEKYKDSAYNDCSINGKLNRNP